MAAIARARAAFASGALLANRPLDGVASDDGDVVERVSEIKKGGICIETSLGTGCPASPFTCESDGGSAEDELLTLFFRTIHKLLSLPIGRSP